MLLLLESLPPFQSEVFVLFTKVDCQKFIPNQIFSESYLGRSSFLLVHSMIIPTMITKGSKAMQPMKSRKFTGVTARQFKQSLQSSLLDKGFKLQLHLYNYQL